MTELPRNLKQFQNMRVQFLSQNRISKDEIYNLHEVAFDINNQFVDYHLFYTINYGCSCPILFSRLYKGYE